MGIDVHLDELKRLTPRYNVSQSPSAFMYHRGAHSSALRNETEVSTATAH